MLSAVRTYLFADTTNRIDIALGAEVIQHLLRLPLRYFDKRPVGELQTRIAELGNIRGFLTGSLLTLALDSVFSVIYIAVMVMYSGVLTAVTLGVVPLFLGLTLIASPAIRAQLLKQLKKCYNERFDWVVEQCAVDQGPTPKTPCVGAGRNAIPHS